ncbi:hypothetical protein BG60_26230 [Caballeronia zhejiangensis]|uniref:Uncharacterized protein n=1 Tax=Caballeronia zhejiangensis TaxID=871203 RepID=A0A656QA58_9BURK|nr:hypothetical protein BG60_26230 [Caballeronia zhejiangensis]
MRRRHNRALGAGLGVDERLSGFGNEEIKRAQIDRRNEIGQTRAEEVFRGVEARDRIVVVDLARSSVHVLYFAEAEQFERHGGRG